MDKELFYKRLVQSLALAHFHLRATDVTKADINTDRDSLSLFIRAMIKFLPSIASGITGTQLPSGLTELYPVFDQVAVQQRLNKMHEYASLVCFKYLLAQPIIVVAVEADNLTHDEMIKVANKFDHAILEMLEFTGKIGGIKLGNIHLGATKLSVTGIILFVFFDHELALRFNAAAQGSCKIQHLWKKTWVLPWTVDVPEKAITQHTGLPIIVPQLLNPDKLSKDVFGV